MKSSSHSLISRIFIKQLISQIHNYLFKLLSNTFDLSSMQVNLLHVFRKRKRNSQVQCCNAKRSLVGRYSVWILQRPPPSVGFPLPPPFESLLKGKLRLKGALSAICIATSGVNFWEFLQGHVHAVHEHYKTSSKYLFKLAHSVFNNK